MTRWPLSFTAYPLCYTKSGDSTVFAYEGVVRELLLGVVRLPILPGGLSVLTAIVALGSLAHAWCALGGRHTLAFIGLSAIMSWAYEQAGVATGLVFGAYHYTGYLGARLGDVPLLIPLAWFMMIYPSYVIANLAIEHRPTGTPPGAARLVRLAAVSAVVMTLWDLVIDPILSGHRSGRGSRRPAAPTSASRSTTTPAGR